nr:uncharacterized protein LOC106691090 isoform X2 [Halyomorpha halys]
MFLNSNWWYRLQTFGLGMATVERSILSLIGPFRDFLLGRRHRTALRFPETTSPRTQPPPKVPPASNDKLADNSYSERDTKVSKEAKEIYSATNSIKSKEAPQKPKNIPTPGNVYRG